MRFRDRKSRRVGPLWFNFSYRDGAFFFTSWGIQAGRFSHNLTRRTTSIAPPPVSGIQPPPRKADSMSYATPLPTPAPVLPGWTPLVFTPAGAPYPTAPYPTPPASRTPRAFDPKDPAAFATDLALQIDAAEQALVDLIKVLARLADGPQPGDAVDAYAVSEELDGRKTTADADRLLLHAANARTLLTTVLDLHHNAPRVRG